MKKYYTHYKNWEDYKNGMYNCTWTEEQEYDLKLKAKKLLSNIEQFRNTLIVVLNEWPISTKQNLTNVGCNRQAWLGQAACCYKYGVPELITRMAWSELTEEERNNANKVADIIINNFELNYENKNIKLHI